MNSTRNDGSVSRRTALASLGAAGIGLALAAPATAQEATPASMAGHPFIGTWLVDRTAGSVTDAPTINIATADGAVFDPVLNVGGVWQAAGPRTALVTMFGLLDRGSTGYIVIRAMVEVDEAGMSLSGDSSATIVGPDGTVLMMNQGTGGSTRLQVQPVEDAGMPLPGVAPWMPETPAATPAT